jgi:hypothetical protein
MLIFHAALMISTYWYLLVHAKKENSNTAVRSVPQIVTSSPAKASTDSLQVFPSLNLCQKYSFANAGNTLPPVVLSPQCCRSTSGRYHPEYITYHLPNEPFTIMNTGKCRTIIRCITDNMFNRVMKKNDLKLYSIFIQLSYKLKKGPLHRLAMLLNL